TTAVAAATAVAAGATTAAVAAAARTRLAGTSLIDRQATAVGLPVVEAVDGGLRLGIAAHLHEAEALAAPRLAIRDDLGALDGAVLREQLLQVRAVHAVREIPDVQFLAHLLTPA